MLSRPRIARSRYRYSGVELPSIALPHPHFHAVQTHLAVVRALRFARRQLTGALALADTLLLAIARLIQGLRGYRHRSSDRRNRSKPDMIVFFDVETPWLGKRSSPGSRSITMSQ